MFWKVKLAEGVEWKRKHHLRLPLAALIEQALAQD